jgi:hypothetical protein
VSVDEARCVRGQDCEEAALVEDPDQPGERYRVGALVHDGPLCPTCLRHIGYALGSIPWDVAELTTLLVPSMEVRYRDPDMPTGPGGKKHPPLELNVHAEALRALIDHEVTTWAEFVAEEAGVPWDSSTAAAQRLGRRVQDGCQLLAHRLPWLLGIPEREYEARSTGEHPTDGHDPDQITYDGSRYWLRRDGVTAALLLLRLHEQVQRFTGRAPADRLPVPCPACLLRGLHREHPRGAGRPGRVVCRACWREMTDDAYEHLVDITMFVFGVAR